MGNRPKIIAFCGRKHSGKTTCAKYIAEKYGYEHIAFATKLKENLAEMLWYSDRPPGKSMQQYLEEMSDPATKEAYRPLMEALGDFKRRDYPDYLISGVRDRIHVGGKIVIDDIRDQKELDLVKSYGGFVVKVQSNKSKHSDHLLETFSDTAKTDALFSNWRAQDNHAESMSYLRGGMDQLMYCLGDDGGSVDKNWRDIWHSAAYKALRAINSTAIL